MDSTSEAIERYQNGWRSGKPIEDPDKLKSWGFVGAKPSEYLVCTRRGALDRARSGQGRRIFKWPWDSVAIVPTTLQRIEFTADQITREHVGVAVTGIAVYRIVSPLLAARVLNFNYVEAASEKLGATLREMFVGAARRLVANLSLDDCLTRRKEAIAGYLMAEIAPVVGGEGAADDTANRGWGVVIDTIEIQQVRVQSEHVFADLQAPFRAAIAGRAELAELDRKRAVAERRAVTDREIRAFAAQAETEAIEREREHRRAKAAADATALEAEHVRLEAMQRQSLFELEHALELRRREADACERDNALAVAHQQRLGDLEQRLAQVRAMQALIAGLPQIALALRQNVGELHVTQIGPGDVLGSVPAAIAQLVALAKNVGLELSR